MPENTERKGVYKIWRNRGFRQKIYSENMIDYRYKNLIQKEFDEGMLKEWFSYKKMKFLHNIDTFYYSVKFKNDFRYSSNDPAVDLFRDFFSTKYDQIKGFGDFGEVRFPSLNNSLVLKPVTFSRFYTICMSYPEYFDIFFAPVVPPGTEESESVTCECIVQIRSYMLWLFGAVDSFENSYEYVKALASMFDLEIDFVQENRVDYCWHTNYLNNPEAFFSPENFYKIRVDRFKNATYVTNKVGSEDYEIDYVALGKRSDKVFVRIYQKTREVIEQGYKPWFLKIWRMNGLINEYDLFVYEKAYLKRSWHYRFFARLEFYALHGSDPEKVALCKDVVEGIRTLEENDLIALADELTPRLNYVINVEFQTMRRHSKSYELVPFKDRRNKGETKRIYDYFDNRKLITDYLTHSTLRLTKYDPEVPKARREDCAFWEALRHTKALDVNSNTHDLKLIRNYNSKLSKEAIKKRFLNSAVTYGIYVAGGENQHSPIQDAFEAILRLNDNDVYNARKYKTKKLRQLNQSELSQVKENIVLPDFQFVDDTGAVYDYNTLKLTDFQGGNI